MRLKGVSGWESNLIKHFEDKQDNYEAKLITAYFFHEFWLENEMKTILS